MGAGRQQPFGIVTGMSLDSLSAVLRHWPLPPPERIEPLGNAGGFSGAALWRLTIGPAQFCLRQWPAGTSSERVEAITRVLRHVGSCKQPLSFVPIPLLSRASRPFVVHEQRAWTLSPWMPGAAVARPTLPQLRNAMQALALFHQAVADFPDHPRQASGSPATLAERRERLSQLDLAPIANTAIPPAWTALERHRAGALAFFREFQPKQLLARFLTAEQVPVPLQLCLRDIWSAHVLFTGETVTGLIDYDAVRVDSVALDLARLLGSYAGDDEALWEAGLSTYGETPAGLTTAERRLARIYDELAVILTPVQWLTWILLERRDFESAVVLPRLDATLPRLEHLKHRLRTSGGLV